jgi:hypothetical protein
MSALVSTAALPREAVVKPGAATARQSPSPSPSSAPTAGKKLTGALQQQSKEARQRAAAILEVLAGGRTPTEAAQALGVSLGRYYLLEDAALAGLVAACEPQPRGQRPDSARRLAALERDCERWRRQCLRQQALVRASQRSLGLAAPPPPPAKVQGKRRRRPVVRALTAAQRLRQEPPAAVPSTAAAMDS